jgi:hypothetical protein
MNETMAELSSFACPGRIDAEIELAVALNDLTNFDLFERGHYAVRASVALDR